MRRRGEDQTDWARVDALAGETLETLIDHDEEGEFDWSAVEVGISDPKQHLTDRFDADEVAWIKGQWVGY